MAEAFNEDTSSSGHASTTRRSTIRTAILGVGGYVGGELARLLLAHPNFAATPPLLLGRDHATSDMPLEQVHPPLARGGHHSLLKVALFTWEELHNHGIEIIFLALPHDLSRKWVPRLLESGVRTIDLSGAWRLHKTENAVFYNHHDPQPSVAALTQSKAVYGCPELHRVEIRQARLVANPGCYATSIILALAPLLAANLVDLDHGIVCDAKSGVSGAGKSPTPITHFMYAAENLSAYSVFDHRHVGELHEQLHLNANQIQFTPHLLPIARGILSTIYLRLAVAMEAQSLEAVLRAFFATSPMVRVHRTPHLPQIQHVVRSNYCDIGFELAPDGRRLVLVSCLDNLLKGAASQAIQNMNLMCGWKEEEGLL